MTAVVRTFPPMVQRARLAPTRPWSLAVVVVAGCGGAASTRPVTPPATVAPTPAAATAAAVPAGTGAPSPPPAPVRYHAQNEAFGTLRGFTVPAVARRPPYRLVHVACTLDQTVAVPRHRCRTVSARMARAAYPDGDSSRVLRWLRGAVGLVDGKAPAGLAAAVAAGLDGEAPYDAGPPWVVALTVTRTYLYDEAISTGCEHAQGHPCDPVSRLTGRKLRGSETDGPYYLHGGRTVDVDSNVDEAAAMVGGTVVYQPVELALIFGDGTAPHLPLLQRAMVPSTAPSAVAELAALDEPDPVVRQILAYDRAVVAARLGDVAATTSAYAALGREVEALGGPAPGLERLLGDAAPFLRRVASGELVFAAPGGLDAYLPLRW